MDVFENVTEKRRHNVHSHANCVLHIGIMLTLADDQYQSEKQRPHPNEGLLRYWQGYKQGLNDLEKQIHTRQLEIPRVAQELLGITQAKLADEGNTDADRQHLAGRETALAVFLRDYASGFSGGAHLS